MKRQVLLPLALLLACCGGDSITPKISTKLVAKRDATGAAITVTVTNETDRPTVPLVVRVEVDGKPVIQPVAFALNRHESHDIAGRVDTTSDFTAQLSVKEAERGVVLKTESVPVAK